MSAGQCQGRADPSFVEVLAGGAEETAVRVGALEAERAFDGFALGNYHGADLLLVTVAVFNEGLQSALLVGSGLGAYLSLRAGSHKNTALIAQPGGNRDYSKQLGTTFHRSCTCPDVAAAPPVSSALSL